MPVGQRTCESCAAWHHAECWTEAQGCAVCSANERRPSSRREALTRQPIPSSGPSLASWLLGVFFLAVLPGIIALMVFPVEQVSWFAPLVFALVLYLRPKLPWEKQWPAP